MPPLPARLSHAVGVATLVVVVAAAPARGDPTQLLSWLNYCTVGSLQFCASVELTLTHVADYRDQFGTYFDRGTAVSVRMRNLQGTLGTTQTRSPGR